MSPANPFFISAPMAFPQGEVVRGLILLCLDGVLSHSRPAPVAINSGPLYHSEPNNSRTPKEIVPIAHRSRNVSSTHTLRDREYLSFIDCSNPPCGHRIQPLWPFLTGIQSAEPLAALFSLSSTWPNAGIVLNVSSLSRAHRFLSYPKPIG